jgi:hypothetical protein
MIIFLTPMKYEIKNIDRCRCVKFVGESILSISMDFNFNHIQIFKFIGKLEMGN